MKEKQRLLRKKPRPQGEGRNSQADTNLERKIKIRRRGYRL